MLTVLFATYNGARTLPAVLNAYCHIHSPEGGWKLVIVDNGSTDQTKDIITSFLPRLPLTYLYESKQGKNVALNTGLASVVGDLVVLTDDDVLPKSDWLQQLRRVADTQSSFSIFGGPVLPHWETPPAGWLLSGVPLGATFAILPPRDEGSISPDWIYGPNMAVRATVFQSGYRFDETIGPKGSSYAMGSETEFTRRLARAGFQAWHCKDAIVQHMIRSFQMTPEWVLKRAIRYGRGCYRKEVNGACDSRASLLGIPLSLVWQIGIKSLVVGRAYWRREPLGLIRERWQLNILLGRALEARLARNGRMR